MNGDDSTSFDLPNVSGYHLDIPDHDKLRAVAMSHEAARTADATRK